MDGMGPLGLNQRPPAIRAAVAAALEARDFVGSEPEAIKTAAADHDIAFTADELTEIARQVEERWQASRDAADVLGAPGVLEALLPPCSCWVSRVSVEQGRDAIRCGAHSLECSLYRESGDPVDREADRELCARMDGSQLGLL